MVPGSCLRLNAIAGIQPVAECIADSDGCGWHVVPIVLGGLMDERVGRR
jgi:hypothetical protein